MAAKAVMVQGTTSHAGKSVLCTALCRIFRQDGFRVAPFKAQNMSLNAYVTADGGEIGRAQGVQAEAAGVEATVDMNPILLKPKGDTVSQVVLRGRPWADVRAADYRNGRLVPLWEAVQESFARLAADHDLIVIEGAGSPAEVNLRGRDLANMRVAALAEAPVILVADIDRGGVFASLVGTLELLEPEERRRVRGLVINKFRGDEGLLEPGLGFLEARTGCAVLGVLPYLADLGIEPEDSVSLAEWRVNPCAELDLAVVRLPYIANFTDFEPFRGEPDVAVRYVVHPASLGRPDALFLPGTKNTTRDLLYLYESGWAEAIADFAARGGPVVGICGGYQMLGREVHDPVGSEEGVPFVAGLGLLDTVTVFRPGKVTRRTAATVVAGAGPLSDVRGEGVCGYEIHAGETVAGPGVGPVFVYSDGTPEGALNREGTVWGTYLHGLFEADGFRRGWLNALRRRRGLAPLPARFSFATAKEEAFDRLAVVVRRRLRLDLVYGWLGLSPAGAAGGEAATAPRR